MATMERVSSGVEAGCGFISLGGYQGVRLNREKLRWLCTELNELPSAPALTRIPGDVALGHTSAPWWALWPERRICHAYLRLWDGELTVKDFGVRGPGNIVRLVAIDEVDGVNVWLTCKTADFVAYGLDVAKVARRHLGRGFDSYFV
jgi:hypothetical protein